MPSNLRANRKSGKMIQQFPNFSGGLNISTAPHQLEDTELVEGWNFNINEEGSVAKRPGFTQIVATLGAGIVQGAYLFKRFTTSDLLAVYNGKLYKYVTLDTGTLLGTGSWSQVLIRRHPPQAVKATVQTSGAVGANLVASTNYDYAVVAKDASGVTVPSSGGVPRGTTGAAPFPIVLTWDKVYGATNYDIYRTINNGALLRVATSVGDVATWTDTGATAPATAAPIANTTLVSIPLTAAVEFVNYNDRVFFTTGDGLCTYSGVLDASLVTPYVPTTTEEANVGLNSIRSTASNIHKCRYIKLHWDKLFLAGDPVSPQNVYFTDLGLSVTFPQVYFPVPYAFDVTTSNGSPVTGMINFRDTLTFFTSDSIHSLFGSQPDADLPDAFILRDTHPNIGTISNRSLVLVGNIVMFVSRLGIYALTNVVASSTFMNVQYLSNKISPEFEKLTRPDICVAVFHDQQYKVCFPYDGTTFKWYFHRQSWALDIGYKFNTYVTIGMDLYCGSYTDGLVFKHGVKRVETTPGSGVYIEQDCYNDNGVAIPFHIRSKTFDLTSLFNVKKFRKLFIAAKQYGVSTSATVKGVIDYTTTSYDFDFNESTSFGTWTLGTSKLGWVDVVIQKERFKGKGRQVYFDIDNAILDEPVTIYGLGVEFKLKMA
jgi:hypothetical protein